MDMWIGGQSFAMRVVRDVLLLHRKVVFVADAVLVIAGVPDFSGRLLANCERVSTLDELDTAGSALIDGWRDEDVYVIEHDGEAVELELSGVAITEERRDEKLGVRCALEMAAALVGKYGDRVCGALLADRGHDEESIPQGLKPLNALLSGGQG